MIVNAKGSDTAKEYAQFKESIDNDTRYYKGKYLVLILEKTNRYNYLVVVLDNFCRIGNKKVEMGKKFRTSPALLRKNAESHNH